MIFKPKRSSSVLAITILVTTAVTVNAAQLSILVTASAGQATPNSRNAAVIHVYLGNSDGSPKNDAAVSPPAGGLPSDWIIHTLSVPAGFETPCILRPGTAAVNLAGQLRTSRVSKLALNEREPTSGLYTFEVLPVAPCGANGTLVSWTPGEYHFMMAYSKGSDRGTVLGVLVVR